MYIRKTLRVRLRQLSVFSANTVASFAPLNPAMELLPGSRWKHYKGGIYTVLMMAKEEANGQEVVVYQEFGPGERQVWVRPAHEWTKTFLTNGADGRAVYVE